jgi:hypothetical protein
MVGRGERERQNLTPNVFNMQDSSLKTTKMKNEFDAINVLTWIHTFRKLFDNGLCMWQAYIMRHTCLLQPLNMLATSLMFIPCII